MGTHRFQLASINAVQIGNLSEPGLVASALAATPQIDVTLANDAFLTDLIAAMAQFGYSFVASAPTTPRATSNLIIDLSDPGAPPVAPASQARLWYDNVSKALGLSVSSGGFIPVIVNPQNGGTFFEDFLTGSGTSLGDTLWVGATSGAGSAVNVGNTNVDATHQGVLALQTGTTATGRALARQAGPAYSNVAASAGGSSRIEFLHTLGDPMPTLAEDYTEMLGWSDNAAVAGFGANGALFVIDRTLSATNWVAKTLVSAVATNTVTGVAVSAAGTWDKLRIDITNGGGAKFYVNGVLQATHAIGTMPTATAGFWAPFVKIEKLVGTTQRRMRVDYASWNFTLAGTR